MRGITNSVSMAITMAMAISISMAMQCFTSEWISPSSLKLSLLLNLRFSLFSLQLSMKPPPAFGYVVFTGRFIILFGAGNQAGSRLDFADIIGIGHLHPPAAGGEAFKKYNFVYGGSQFYLIASEVGSIFPGLIRASLIITLHKVPGH